MRCAAPWWGQVGTVADPSAASASLALLGGDLLRGEPDPASVDMTLSENRGVVPRLNRNRFIIYCIFLFFRTHSLSFHIVDKISHSFGHILRFSHFSFVIFPQFCCRFGHIFTVQGGHQGPGSFGRICQEPDGRGREGRADAMACHASKWLAGFEA